SAGVVELAGLADDDRAGSDDEDAMKVVATRHVSGSVRQRKVSREAIPRTDTPRWSREFSRGVPCTESWWTRESLARRFRAPTPPVEVRPRGPGLVRTRRRTLATPAGPYTSRRPRYSTARRPSSATGSRPACS